MLTTCTWKIYPSYHTVQVFFGGSQLNALLNSGRLESGTRTLKKKKGRNCTGCAKRDNQYCHQVFVLSLQNYVFILTKIRLLYCQMKPFLFYCDHGRFSRHFWGTASLTFESGKFTVTCMAFKSRFSRCLNCLESFTRGDCTSKMADFGIREKS
jgi:hypothetical protein